VGIWGGYASRYSENSQSEGWPCMADPRRARTKNYHTAAEEFAVLCADTETVSGLKGRDWITSQPTSSYDDTIRRSIRDRPHNISSHVLKSRAVQTTCSDVAYLVQFPVYARWAHKYDGWFLFSKHRSHFLRSLRHKSKNLCIVCTERGLSTQECKNWIQVMDKAVNPNTVSWHKRLH
jgi:hypothetical protein